MRTRFPTLTCLIVLATLVTQAQTAPPLIDLPLAADLANQGSLGGTAAFTQYAEGEGPLWDVAPLGGCVDLTRASRHGGALGADTGASGGAVVFPGDQLVGVDSFTVVVWARQNPVKEGVSSRLAMTETGWDLLPTTGGVALSFLADGEKKTTASLTIPPFERGRVPALTDWRFTAVAVDQDTVRGCLGGLTGDVVPFREAPRPGPLRPAWGKLVIGNLMGIRPFNGWMARFRIYDRALSMEEMSAIAAADRADAAQAGMTVLQPRPDADRPMVFKRSAIPFSTRWQRPEALAVMESFHATDCLWVYGNKPDFAAAVQAAGLRYQGAMHGLQGLKKATPEKSAAGDPSGRHEDLDGNKNMPSWMVTFKPPHLHGLLQPARLPRHLLRRRQGLRGDGGRYDPRGRRGHERLLGEPCGGLLLSLLPRRFPRVPAPDPHGRRAARPRHRRHRRLRLPRAPACARRPRCGHLPQGVQGPAADAGLHRLPDREHAGLLSRTPRPARRLVAGQAHSRLGQRTPAPAGRRPSWPYLYHADIVDFYHGEAYDRTFAINLTANKTAEAIGLQNISTPVLQGVADGARTLALAYALGQFQLVPWDVYMGSDATGSVPRYMGTRTDFGAYYDLIHAQPQLFDTARSLASVGVLVNADVEDTPHVTQFCEGLAARQIPFELLVAATRQARIPLRETDLRGLRALITLSPVETLAADDRACLERVLADRRLRLVDPATDLAAILAARGLDPIRLEGPPGVYLFPRQAEDGTVLIHVVNWNISADPSRAETYDFVTVGLRRWGAIRRATYWQPGAEPVELTPEVHADSVRLTLPRLQTWGIVELAPAGR